MLDKKVKLLVLMTMVLCLNAMPKIAHAETNENTNSIKKETQFTNKKDIITDEDVLFNETALANELQKNESTKEEYKIERNWLTKEVASQLNKEVDKLVVEDFSYVVKIDLRYTKIDDTIPKEIELLKNLQYLDLNYCRLSGDIPESIAQLNKLTHLDLADNKLEDIPEVLEQKLSDKQYAYCDIEGNKFTLTEGWHYLKGKWCYLDRYGDRLKGEQTIEKVTYDFGEEGFVKEGWEQVDNIWHYYDRASGMVKDSWKQIDGKWYYFNEEGIMLTGMQTIKGTKYCLASNGEMLTGMQNIGGSTYSFASTGGMQYGWITVNGKKYYFDETTGAMVTGVEKVIGGKKYKFGSDGLIQSNVWLDTYTYVQPNGETVNTYYNYSHSNTNYQLFKYMTDPVNQISVDKTAVQLHGGITSNNCVYFASEALRRTGVGIPYDTCNTYQLENELKYMGFVPCYDFSQLKPGDIVFTNNYSHVYIFMCWDKDGYAYIVDNQSYNFNNQILHKRNVYNDTAITDRATHFYYYPN